MAATVWQLDGEVDVTEDQNQGGWLLEIQNRDYN